MATVHTWADGHGRWHATVDDTPKGLTRAVEAIVSELAERAPAGVTAADLVGYVHAHIVSLPGALPGRVHFAEYALEDARQAKAAHKVAIS